MIRLIRNELSKIFKKKVIYILFTIIALIIIANTIIGTNIYGGIVIDHTEEARQQEQIELGDKIQKLDSGKNIDEYIETKTKLDIVNLEREYPLGSWQEQAIVKCSNKIEQMIKEINIYTYQIKDNEKFEKAKKTYDNFFEPLKENKWRNFINLQIKELEDNIESIEKEISKVKDKEQKYNLINQMEQYKFDLEFLKIRLEQNISYEKSDRNTLIEEYKSGKQILKFQSKSYEECNYKEKLQYNKVLANVNELEYKIYNNIPTIESDNARDMLNNTFQFYEILIILVIVVVSGSIVSDEFNKGTIKLLLVKPHERWKILLSKLIAAIVLTIILILFIIMIQFLTGGFVYGFEDYGEPLIQYNFNTQNVMEINVFCSVVILMLAKIPMYLLVLSITFAMSTISCNTALSIVVGILIYLSKNVIYLNENTQFLRYLLPVNWDFTMYLYGKLPEVSFLKIDLSIMICLISFILIMLITFECFKNKDIKNI